MAPDSGQYPLTMFTFGVVVTDADGDVPTSAEIELERDGEPWHTKRLYLRSGSTSTGATYRYRRRLPPGHWRYRFVVRDGDGPAAGAPTQWMDGPGVVPRLNQRPDGAIWNGQKWVGDNYYNATAGKQRVNGEITAGGWDDYIVRVENDRADPDTLVIKGTPSRRDWTITYLTRKGADITSDVTGDGWATPALAGGTSTRITARIAVANDADPGAEKAVLVQVGRAVWGPTKYAGFADTVKAVTTVEGATSMGALHITGLTALPTSTGAQVQFALSSAAQVDARVLNIAGWPVRTIYMAKDCEFGTNTLIWNAMSEDGLRVPNGVYLVEVTAKTGDGGQSKALVPLRIGR